LHYKVQLFKREFFGAWALARINACLQGHVEAGRTSAWQDDGNYWDGRVDWLKFGPIKVNPIECEWLTKPILSVNHPCKNDVNNPYWFGLYSRR